jgi:hypothetical protein
VMQLLRDPAGDQFLGIHAMPQISCGRSTR